MEWIVVVWVPLSLCFKMWEVKIFLPFSFFLVISRKNCCYCLYDTVEVYMIHDESWIGKSMLSNATDVELSVVLRREWESTTASTTTLIRVKLMLIPSSDIYSNCIFLINLIHIAQGGFITSYTAIHHNCSAGIGIASHFSLHSLLQRWTCNNLFWLPVSQSSSSSITCTETTN